MAPTDANKLYLRLEQATAQLDPPFALVDLDAFDQNAADLLTRANGKPIRVASKSIRCRHLLEYVLARPGFKGVMGFTLPEALWLSQHGFDDVLVAYPTVDRQALAELASSKQALSSITLMVDDVAQLDWIERYSDRAKRAVRLCIELDAAFPLLHGKVRLGAKRSPLNSAQDVVALGKEIARRSHFQLVGLMSYEAQIASLGDDPSKRSYMGSVLTKFREKSAIELAQRRAEVVNALAEVTPLEFVNGGGTGSIETTREESVVTEIAAGSGLFAPVIFDDFKAFKPLPAAMFALPVVRRPKAGVVTALGGGYISSSASQMLPTPFLPPGLKLDKQEGAGEVQTPLIGKPADKLQIGSRVYMRHAKAGELCERFSQLQLIRGETIERTVPTYRGEGQTFL